MESDDSVDLSDDDDSAPHAKELKIAQSNRSLNSRKSQVTPVTPKNESFEKAFGSKLTEKEKENVVTSNPNSVGARLLKRASIMPDEFVSTSTQEKK